MPQEYFAASRDFDAFMADAKEALGRHVNGEDFERVPAGGGRKRRGPVGRSHRIP